MGYKWIGAVLVVAGCGGFGFSLARETLRQEALLRGLLTSLELMENQINVHGQISSTARAAPAHSPSVR